MLYVYHAIKRGASHKVSGEPCQDFLAFCVRETMLVAAVADGIGSEKHSDMASKKAARTAVKTCASKIHHSLSDKEILEAIKDGFQKAVYSIEDEAEKQNYPLDECNTTLSLAVFKDGQIYFGHAGDSGIIALRADGRCIKITEQKNDEEGGVFTLAFKENWEFCKAEGLFAGVLLATDGLLETFFPDSLSKEPEPLYIAHLMRFLDKDRLDIVTKGATAVQKEAQVFIESIPHDVVDDDIALVVLLNSDINAGKQPPEYYKVPDFEALQKQRIDTYGKYLRCEMVSTTLDAESNGGDNL